MVVGFQTNKKKSVFDFQETLTLFLLAHAYFNPLWIFKSPTRNKSFHLQAAIKFLNAFPHLINYSFSLFNELIIPFWFIILVQKSAQEIHKVLLIYSQTVWGWVGMILFSIRFSKPAGPSWYDSQSMERPWCLHFHHSPSQTFISKAQGGEKMMVIWKKDIIKVLILSIIQATEIKVH